MYIASSIVPTLTVIVAMLSANKLKIIVFNTYIVFYRVDTNGCSRNAQCQQAKMMVGNVYTTFYSIDTNDCNCNA